MSSPSGTNTTRSHTRQTHPPDSRPKWIVICGTVHSVHAMRGLPGVLLESMARTARMIEGHLEEILVHWTRGLTTAFMEGLNSLLSGVKRRARGYRAVEHMTAVLYFVAGKLTLSCYYSTENSDKPTIARVLIALAARLFATQII